MGIIWWIIVGLIAGWLTGKIMGGGGRGALTDLIRGVENSVDRETLLSGVTGGLRKLSRPLATLRRACLTWSCASVRAEAAAAVPPLGGRGE